MLFKKSNIEFGGCLHFETMLSDKSNGQYYEHFKNNKVDSDCGRSAIQYILSNIEFNNLWLPVYNCPLVADRIKTVFSINIKFYNINEEFFPLIDPRNIERNDVILWVNYFGVMPLHLINKIAQIKNKYNVNIIIDNIPAYFSEPIMDVFNIYSCRKFIGVPNGAHIITDKLCRKELQSFDTAEKYLYLLKAKESGSSHAYQDYLSCEKNFSISKTVYGMPKLTESILRSVDYDKIKIVRKTNFLYLHKYLKNINLLKNVDFNSDTPSVYPLLIVDKNLRKQLLSNNVFVSMFWKHVLSNPLSNSFEKVLAEYLIPLPIDQRYNIGDMEILVNIIKSQLNCLKN